MSTGMCMDMSTDICMDMSMHICMDMCMDMCMGISIDMFMDMCVDMCMGMFMDLYMEIGTDRPTYRQTDTVQWSPDSQLPANRRTDRLMDGRTQQQTHELNDQPTNRLTHYYMLR